MPFFTAFAIIELTSPRVLMASSGLLFFIELLNLFRLVLILVRYCVLTAFFIFVCPVDYCISSLYKVKSASNNRNTLLGDIFPMNFKLKNYR